MAFMQSFLLLRFSTHKNKIPFKVANTKKYTAWTGQAYLLLKAGSVGSILRDIINSME
jgi:hypothetical protein